MQIKKKLTKFSWFLFLLMGFGMLAKTTLAQNCVPQPRGYGLYTVTGIDCGIPAGFLTGCGVGFYTVADGSCRAIGVPTSPPYPVVVITGTPGGGGVDSVWEQYKLEARKLLENAAESHTSTAGFVGRILHETYSSIIEICSKDKFPRTRILLMPLKLHPSWEKVFFASSIRFA